MATLKQEKKYHCFNDCDMSGCPGHIMSVSIQTTSENLSVQIDGKSYFSADPSEWKALKELLTRIDYNFFDLD